MAIVLEAVYAKKLGLPGYSSHQYSLSIRTELSDLTQVGQESSRLYGLLQDSVDQSIQQTGFLPEESHNGNGAARNGSGGHKANGNGNGGWRCSDKQRGLIEKIVGDKNLDKNEVEQMAQEMFSAGVRQLDRLQASGLIDELFERHGGGARRNAKPRSNGNGHSRPDMAGYAANARTMAKPAAGGPAS